MFDYDPSIFAAMGSLSGGFNGMAGMHDGMGGGMHGGGQMSRHQRAEMQMQAHRRRWVGGREGEGGEG